jgi:hypothetical protein
MGFAKGSTHPKRSMILPDGQISEFAVQPPFAKIFRFSADPKSNLELRHPVPEEGRITRSAG